MTLKVTKNKDVLLSGEGVLVLISVQGIHISFERIELKTNVRVGFYNLCINCHDGTFLITVGRFISVS